MDTDTVLIDVVQIPREWLKEIPLYFVFTQRSNFADQVWLLWLYGVWMVYYAYGLYVTSHHGQG